MKFAITLMIKRKGDKMSEIISKELLSEVLGIDKRLCSTPELIDNTLFFDTLSNVGEHQNYINIHELAYKCKELAISKGWVLHEVRNLKEYIVYFSGDGRNPSDDYRSNTEPEAIFKATSYIMEQLKQKEL